MGQKHFGTDGIRGLVGEPNHTRVLPSTELGNWQGFHPEEGRRPHILIGKDTRISGYMLESVLQSGFVSAGADVSLLGPIPTPAIAYLTRALSADAGVVISASHNPYYDNGIKLFDSKGNKLGDELEQKIEAMIGQPMVCEDSASLGKASRVNDATGRYVEFCKNSVPRDFSLRGIKVVLDCAHGASYQTGPRVFNELGRMSDHSAEPDGFNINERCGSTHPEQLQQRVIEEAADLGIAFDGDGDRLVMVDEKGDLLDGDHLLYVITRSRQSRQTMQGGVVGTVMSNLGLERAPQELSVPFVRAKVGDRHIMEALHQRQWTLGGEPSGHILTLDLCSTGDAIIAGLQVLVGHARRRVCMSEVASRLSKAPQVLLINVDVESPAAVCGHADLVKAIAKARKRLGDRGRILVRPSGTEPLLRIMVEGENDAEVARVADDLAAQAQAIKRLIGSRTLKTLASDGLLFRMS